MDGGEIVVAICAILFFIGFIYLFAMLSLAKRLRLLQAQSGRTTLTSDGKTPEIKKCPQCGRVLVDEFGFCAGCGADFNEGIVNA